ncbi:MAG: hypothetical protein NVSMB31_12960 [Vulcanimicrobiaceae bacterium]
MNARPTYYAGMFFMLVTLLQAMLPTLNFLMGTVAFLLGTTCMVLLFMRPHTPLFTVSLRWQNGLLLAAPVLMLASVPVNAFYPALHTIGQILPPSAILTYLQAGASQEIVSRVDGATSKDSQAQ